jgi:hypothetical protein
MPLWLSYFLRALVLAMSSVGATVALMASVPALLASAGQADWQAASAQLESVADSSGQNGSGSGPFTIDVRYRYSFSGRAYTSTQFALDGHLPSSFASQREHYQLLASAFKEGRSVTAYVNLANPNQAVLARGVGIAAWFVAFVGLALLVVLAVSIRVMWPHRA